MCAPPLRPVADGPRSPNGIRNGLVGFEERGLARVASQAVEAFITVDQNVQFQQNLAKLPLPAAILVAPDNRFETLAPYASTVNDWLRGSPARDLVRIEGPERIVRVGG